MCVCKLSLNKGNYALKIDGGSQERRASDIYKLNQNIKKLKKIPKKYFICACKLSLNKSRIKNRWWQTDRQNAMEFINQYGTR